MRTASPVAPLPTAVDHHDDARRPRRNAHRSVRQCCARRHVPHQFAANHRRDPRRRTGWPSLPMPAGPTHRPAFTNRGPRFQVHAANQPNITTATSASASLLAEPVGASLGANRCPPPPLSHPSATSTHPKSLVAAPRLVGRMPHNPLAAGNWLSLRVGRQDRRTSSPLSRSSSNQGGRDTTNSSPRFPRRNVCDGGSPYRS